MAGSPFRTTAILLLTLIGLAAYGAGCAPGPSSLATPSLPPPQVAITRWVLPPSPSPVTSPTPEPYPGDYAALYHLAVQAHGEESLIQWISIPALSLESLVVPVGWQVRHSEAGKEQVVWDSPGPFVGWAITGALPGERGRILLYGHNNLYGSVFRYLYRLQPGDRILLRTGVGEWEYTVSEVHILAAGDLEKRYQTDLFSSSEETPSLFLLSCYPPENNTHRVLVTAVLSASPP